MYREDKSFEQSKNLLIKIICHFTGESIEVLQTSFSHQKLEKIIPRFVDQSLTSRANPDYFLSQENLKTDNNDFDKFEKIEKTIYSQIIACMANPVKGDNPEKSHENNLPNKSRIVVISKKELWNDILRKDRPISEFICWHKKNKFGLKFFIYDTGDFKDGKISSYSEELQGIYKAS